MAGSEGRQQRIRSAGMVALLACGGGGCRSEQAASPPLPEDTRSVLWASDDGRGWRIEAADLAPGEAWRFSQVIPAGTALAVLAYRDPLFSFGLSQGPVSPSDDPQARPLPSPAQVLTGQIDDDDVAWQRADVLPRGLDNYRIAPFDIIACLDAGACLDAALPAGRCVAGCAPSTPAPPAPPAAPVIAPGPSGWAPVDEGGLIVCEPGEASTASCPAGSALRPGAVACATIGRACGERFAEAPAGARAVYVDAAAPPGGSGSPQRPFDRLETAMTGPTPAAVMVAAGQYVLTTLRDGDVIIGACARDVRVAAPAADLVLSDVQVGLRNVIVTANVRVEAAAALVADGVDFQADLDVALGASATVRDSRLVGLQTAGTVALRQVELDGGGLSVAAGGSAVIDHVRGRRFEVGLSVGPTATATGAVVVFEDGATALSVDGATRLALSDVVIRRTTAGGVRVLGGAVELSRLHAADLAGTAVVVAGGDVQVDDGRIADVRPDDDEQGEGGWGVAISAGRFAGRRLRIERVSDSGVRALGRDAIGELEDTVLQDISASPTGDGRTSGANASDGAALTMARVEIRNVERRGISTFSSSDVVRVIGRDILIDGIWPRPDGSRGEGIVADDGTEIRLERVRILRANGFGMALKDGRTSGLISDLEVRQTRAATRCTSDDCRLGNGVGVVVYDAGSLRLDRFALRDNGDVGLRTEATLGVNVVDGVVEGSRLGLWNSDPTLRLDGLVEGVAFRSNQQNVRDDR